MMALDVQDLTVHFPTTAGDQPAVDGVSFTLRRGQTLGLVGESGSGKTMTGYAILRLVPPPGRITGGLVRLNGQSLAGLSEPAMRQLRGNRIALIMQDPMSCLNDVLRVGTQMTEAVRAHRRVRRTEARALARDALGRMGIPHPEERLDAYPHEFSGGMRQRIAIATALLNKPDVIIADEPTTALDVTIQAQILSEVQRICAADGMAMLWITHDLSVVAGLADEIAVMYAGRIVERGLSDAVIASPLHPYAEGLMASVPARNQPGERLRQIPGTMPGLGSLPGGCTFRPRCSRADPVCEQVPALAELRPQHHARCFHPLQPAV
ncbi:MAG TPA: ABC transporter ATP-binding protein [Acetobacteraceae bacterium]